MAMLGLTHRMNPLAIKAVICAALYGVCSQTRCACLYLYELPVEAFYDCDNLVLRTVMQVPTRLIPASTILLLRLQSLLRCLCQPDGGILCLRSGKGRWTFTVQSVESNCVGDSRTEGDEFWLIHGNSLLVGKADGINPLRRKKDRMSDGNCCRLDSNS